MIVEFAMIDLGARSLETALEADLDPPPEQFDAIVLSAPDHVVGIYVPLCLDEQVVTRLRSWRPLSLAPHDIRVTRVDANTLDLEVVDGAMMTSLFEQLYRSKRQAFRIGDVLDRGLLRVTILAVSPEGPTRVRFRVERSLNLPSIRLLAWRDGRLRRVAPPEVGETIVLTREIGPARL